MAKLAIKKHPKPAGISAKVINILTIYRMIAQKSSPTIKGFEEACGVGERTIYRYLEIIDLIDPIEHDRESGNYTFTYGDSTKKPSLTEEELIILFTSGQAVSHLGQTFRDSFQNIMKRIVATPGKAIPEGKPYIIIKIPDAIRSEKVDQYFKAISGCIARQCSIEMTYRAQHSKEETQRIVDPYGLVYYDGVWMLVGYCHLRKEIRTFALDRVLGIKERALFFEPLEGFDLEKFVRDTWGIYQSREASVTVKFAPAIADYILRKEKWHPSEKRKILPDGSVTLSFRVQGVNELKKWIYSWIPHVEVLRPKWLREEIAKELGTTAAIHS